MGEYIKFSFTFVEMLNRFGERVQGEELPGYVCKRAACLAWQRSPNLLNRK
jgi:hypothetical protein